MGNDFKDFAELRASSSNFSPPRLGEAPGASRSFIRGDVVGPFEIEERLGAGGAGSVYRARDRRDDQLYALKVVEKDTETDDLVRARLSREAHALSRISSEYVVRLQDYFELQDGRLVIVMEYAPGDTLRKLADSQRLSFMQVLELFEQLASGLAAVHAIGIVHRDLKPGNIVIERGRDGAMMARIVDFGIAFSQSDVRITVGFVGTPAYSCPEQILVQPLDAKSDIYSLGVIVWELVMGRLPFTGEKPFEQLEHHVKTPAPSISWGRGPHPPGFDLLSSLLGRMLEKEPALRPKSMAQVQREIGLVRDAFFADAEQPRQTLSGWSGAIASTIALEKGSPFFSLEIVKRPGTADGRHRLVSNTNVEVTPSDALCIFDNATNELLAKLPLASHPTACHVDDGGVLLAGEEGFHRADFGRGALVPEQLGSASDVTAIARDPRRNRFAIARGEALTLLRRSTTPSQQHVSFKDVIMDVALSPVEPIVVVVTDSDFACIDIGESLTVRWQHPTRSLPQSIAFSPDGYLMATLTGRIIQVRSVIDGSLLAESEHERLVAIHFDSDGRLTGLEIE